MATATARAPGELIRKTVTAKATKTAGGFTALVSRFGNVDSQGDVVLPGAFAKSLAERGDRPIPVVWTHETRAILSYVGKATATETDEGLLVEAEFFDTPEAQHVRLLMEEGLVVEFSWQGRVLDGDLVKVDEDHYAFGLKEIDLWEVGPTLKGANAETELLGVKALTDRLASKEGRVLAQQHVETLKSIHEQLGGVIDAVGKKEPTHSYDEGKADDGAPPGAPEPDAGDGDGDTDHTKAEGTEPPAFSFSRRVALELAVPLRNRKDS